MTLGSVFREAAQALRFNRQRSILTTISLAWGVACFVILYSYGDGFHFALRRAFLEVGQDLVLMFGGQTSMQAGGERAGRRVRLEAADVDAIRETVPLVAAISPELMMRRHDRGARLPHGHHHGAGGAAGLRADPQPERGLRPLPRARRRDGKAARGGAGRQSGRKAVRRNPARRAKRSPSTGCASR